MVLTKDEYIREACLGTNAEAVSDRPTLAVITLLRGGEFGLSFTRGNIWRKQRRFALHVLRDFGIGACGKSACIAIDDVIAHFILQDAIRWRPRFHLNSIAKGAFECICEL